MKAMKKMVYRIQIIIRIMAQVLAFWCRGAKGDVKAEVAIDEQIQACQVRARVAGYKDVSIYRERRPEFKRLLQAARNGEVDVVYVYDGDRSSRKRLHRDDPMGSSESQGVRDECFTAAELVFKLANAGCNCGSIAAVLNEIACQSENSESWDASTLKGILEKEVDDDI